jgi:hypothetical protein
MCQKVDKQLKKLFRQLDKFQQNIVDLVREVEKNKKEKGHKIKQTLNFFAETENMLGNIRILKNEINQMFLE